MLSSKILQALFIVVIGVFNTASGADSKKPDPVVGEWKWFTKDTMVIHADGRLTQTAADGSSKAKATWRRLNPGEVPCRYEVTWPKIKAIDILILENDETRLSGVGKNIYGDHVSAQRMSHEDPDKPADDFIHDHNAALIIVKADEGAASGFIGKSGQSTLLFTNVHVLADLDTPTFTRLDGVTVSTGAADLAAGRDIARFEVKNPPNSALEISTDFNDSVHIGDQVVVPGNSGGGGVATMIKGAVVGIGPDRVEVSAPFVPGNSGSPIIHVKTGKVIGIATYLTMRNEDPTKSRAVAVRHFGYRIDTAATWERVDWDTFQEEADGVKEVSALTDDVINFLNALRTRQPPDFETDTLRGPAGEWMKALRNQRLTMNGRRAVTENFLRVLKVIVASDVLDLEPGLHYSYFQEEMRAQHEIRRRLYDAISKASLEL